jgi:hypothetical protein
MPYVMQARELSTNVEIRLTQPQGVLTEGRAWFCRRALVRRALGRRARRQGLVTVAVSV